MLENVLKYLPNITEDMFRKLVAYAIAGAGFGNMEKVLNSVSEQELLELDRMFDLWLGGRNLSTFFHALFDDYGYTIDEVR